MAALSDRDNRNPGRAWAASALAMYMLAMYMMSGCAELLGVDTDVQPYPADAAADAGVGGTGTSGGGGAGGHAGNAWTAGTGGTAGEGGGAGAASTAGTAGESGASGPASDAGAGNGGTGGGATMPNVINAEFAKYGELALSFDADLPGRVEVDVSPEQPTEFTVDRVDVSGTQAVVSMHHNQLPIDYSLKIRIFDGSGSLLDEVDYTLPAAKTHSLVGFVSRASGNGNILGWAAVPEPLPSSSLEAGNAICQAEADAAGLKGTFIAWLPTAARDPVCLIQGLSGLAATNCDRGGVLSMPNFAWVRPDGLPLLVNADGMHDNTWRTRIALYADGAPVPPGNSVWIGKPMSVDPNSTLCADWTSSSTNDRALSFNLPETTMPFRLFPPLPDCSHVAHLLCLQLGRNGVELGAAHARAGRRIFASRTLHTGALVSGSTLGLEAGDAICAADAGGAGLTSETGWVAWLSSSTADAACRIDGLTGTLGNACDFGTRPADRSFVRADGVVVASGLSDLTDGSVFEPLMVQADLDSSASNLIWTGTNDSGSANPVHCDGFTSTSGMGMRGLFARTRNWSGTTSGSACTTEFPILCVER